MSVDFIISIVAPACGGIGGAFLGYYLGRWQRHKEILYSKKIEVYASVISHLLDFRLQCAPGGSIPRAFEAFTHLFQVIHKAGLYMPDALQKDIYERSRPAIDRIHAMNECLHRLKKLHGGDTDLGIDFETFRKETVNALKDFSSLPGPFQPLCDATGDIILMLKADLGIRQLGGRFYGT